MKFVNSLFLLLFFIVSTGCGPKAPEKYKEWAKMPVIYPDYREVAIPVNIAPLHFVIREDGKEFITRFQWDTGEKVYCGEKIILSKNDCKEILKDSKGKKCSIDVFVQRDGKWYKYHSFSIYVMEDNTYENIMALYGYPNRLDGDQNLAEIYLLNYFANTWSEEPLSQENLMMTTLVKKNIPLFWSRFFSYMKTHQNIPVHYQEAAALYCYLEREYNPETLPIDDEVRLRFQAFQNLIAQNPGRSEESLKPLFRSQFGDTFWFFYFFVKNVKSN